VHHLLENSQASPAHPSDSRSMTMKSRMVKMRPWNFYPLVNDAVSNLKVICL
jgi:hypothetical protein